MIKVKNIFSEKLETDSSDRRDGGTLGGEQILADYLTLSEPGGKIQERLLLSKLDVDTTV